LRAVGSTRAVRAFLTSSAWAPCAVFFRGQPRFSKSKDKSKISGFNLLVSGESGLSLGTQIRAAERFLAGEPRELRRLRSLDINAWFDFGVTAPPWAACSFYRFRTDFIAKLASAGLGLEVSYYGKEEPKPSGRGRKQQPATH
jgi:hypothetical protein